MSARRVKQILISAFTLLTLAIIGGSIWAVRLQDQISTRLKNGWFAPPIEYYAPSQSFAVNQRFTITELRENLLQHGYLERRPDQRRLPGDFAVLDTETCTQQFMDLYPEIGDTCVVLSRKKAPFGFVEEEMVLLIKPDGLLQRTRPEHARVELEPKMFAQFFGDQLILRDILPLGAIPLACLQAVTAIEDSDFLEHKGVSLTGTIRAVARNILKGRFAEGGSTITQQLVKNAFLTHQKTLRRKLNEQVMALLLEQQFDKDQILQSYLNEIYMGQSGAFEIRGFGAASRQYFNKSVDALDLADCALLAALINSPGRYSPFLHPEAAAKRRALVLERMEHLKMISAQEQIEAVRTPLPTAAPARQPLEPAPYVVRELNRMLADIPHDQGLRVLTSIDLEAQTVAQRTLRENIDRLESTRADLKAWKDKGRMLEGALVSVDIKTGRLLAMVGGRDYKKTQLNRIYESRRQVGSTMKPFVYLTAFEHPGDHKEPYSPLTSIEDQPFSHRYEGQVWTPNNYDHKYHGRMPLYYALKESLNIPTVKLGLDVGLENVVEVARRAGIESPLKALPSLTLGAFELKPIELAEAYLSLARLGMHQEPTLLTRAEDLDGNELIDNTAPSEERVFAAGDVALLVGMLRNTMISGTARASTALGFHGIAAGKTGTTSDLKDSWFVGFTPQVLTLVWVGYDDNTPTGMTGANSAMPIWVKFMTEAFPLAGQTDFVWPDDVKIEHLDAEKLKAMFSDFPATEASGVDLILRK